MHMIDSFVNFGDHGNPKSGENKGRCQPPLSSVVGSWLLGHDICLSRDRGKGGAGVVFPGGGGKYVSCDQLVGTARHSPLSTVIKRKKESIKNQDTLL